MKPTARASMRRWAESGLTALLAGVLIWQGGRLALWGGWFGWWFGWLLLAAGAGAMLWCLAAVQRARVHGKGDGPGAVTVEERRIGYFGPDGGGFVDIDDLERVELRPGERGGTWLFVPVEGAPLVIPGAAAGADRLVDAMTALPGFSTGAAAELLDTRRGNDVTIWRRHRPALARPGGPA